MNRAAATTVAIPASLVQAYSQGHPPAELQRWAMQAMVLTAVSESLVSVGQAAEMLGMGYFETLALIRKRGIPLKTTDEEYERDQADLLRISAELKLS